MRIGFIGRTLAVAAIATIGLAMSSPARATDENVKLCVKDAKATYREAKATTKEDFQIAKDACRGRDHACVEACRDERHSCRIAASAALDADLAACAATKATAVGDCVANNPAGSTALDDCIDAAQIAAFICRDTAREAHKPNFKPCREAFKTCAAACTLP